MKTLSLYRSVLFLADFDQWKQDFTRKPVIYKLVMSSSKFNFFAFAAVELTASVGLACAMTLHVFASIMRTVAAID